MRLSHDFCSYDLCRLIFSSLQFYSDLYTVIKFSIICYSLLLFLHSFVPSFLSFLFVYVCLQSMCVFVYSHKYVSVYAYKYVCVWRQTLVSTSTLFIQTGPFTKARVHLLATQTGQWALECCLSLPYIAGAIDVCPLPRFPVDPEDPNTGVCVKGSVLIELKLSILFSWKFIFKLCRYIVSIYSHILYINQCKYMVLRDIFSFMLWLTKLDCPFNKNKCMQVFYLLLIHGGFLFLLRLAGRGAVVSFGENSNFIQMSTGIVLIR